MELSPATPPQRLAELRGAAGRDVRPRKRARAPTMRRARAAPAAAGRPGSAGARAPAPACGVQGAAAAAGACRGWTRACANAGSTAGRRSRGRRMSRDAASGSTRRGRRAAPRTAPPPRVRARGRTASSRSARPAPAARSSPSPPAAGCAARGSEGRSPGRSTHAGAPIPPSGSTTRWRKRGTSRVPQSCAARKRSHSGVVSSSSRPQTVERRRGSSSARHISASTGFISRSRPQLSGLSPARKAGWADCCSVVAITPLRGARSRVCPGAGRGRHRAGGGPR